MENKNNSTNLPALYTLMTVWFFWSFVAASNGILIPLFKEKFELQQWQAQLVDFAFYAAYFVGSVLYLLLSSIMKTDILNKIGYKNGIIYGLIISAVGSLIFYPAAEMRLYSFFLFALFVIACGLAFLETAANPYVTVLGDPKSSESRINFSQSFNGLSIILGPVVGSLFIFSSTEYTNEMLAAMPAMKAASSPAIARPRRPLGRTARISSRSASW